MFLIYTAWFPPFNFGINSWTREYAILFERAKNRATFIYNYKYVYINDEYILTLWTTESMSIYMDLLICDEIKTIFITDVYSGNNFEKREDEYKTKTCISVIENMRPGYKVEFYNAQNFKTLKKSYPDADWAKYLRISRSRPEKGIHIMEYDDLFAEVYDSTKPVYHHGGVKLKKPIDTTPFWAPTIY